MKARPANAALVLTALGGLTLGVRLAAWPLVLVVVPPPASAAAVVSNSVSPLEPDSLVHLIVARDPFRMTRRPSNVVYDPMRLAQPATPPAPKPALALVGIVWDNARDPTALFEGLPRADGPRPPRSREAIAGRPAPTIKSGR